jgi:Gp5 N-terminal OB domain
MSSPVKHFIGRDGFVWFIGVVEDRIDPEKLGRVKVRCFGWHTDDKAAIPTKDLPWAFVTQAPNYPATYTPKEGDYVFGFFMDGDYAQNPVVMGVIPGKPSKKPDYNKGFTDPRTSFGSTPTDEAYPLKKKLNEPTNSRLARGRIDGTVIETRKRNLKKAIKNIGGATWNEPEPSYAPKYPYNDVLETESGHAFELDDTKGKERINLAHKNGSFIEMDYNGNRVEKVMKDGYSVTMGNDFVYVEGNCNVTVGGNCNLKVVGKLNVEASEINMSATGDVKIKAGGSMKLEAGGGMDIKAGGAGKFGSGGKLSLKGSNASLQGGSVSLYGQVKNKVKIPPGTDKPGGIGKILKESASAADSPAGTGLATPS